MNLDVASDFRKLKANKVIVKNLLVDKQSADFC